MTEFGAQFTGRDERRLRHGTADAGQLRGVMRADRRAAFMGEDWRKPGRSLCTRSTNAGDRHVGLLVGLAGPGTCGRMVDALRRVALMGTLFYTDAADLLRAAGLVVVECDGWKSRARSSGGFASAPLGCQWHNTASNTSPDERHELHVLQRR